MRRLTYLLGWALVVLLSALGLFVLVAEYLYYTFEPMTATFLTIVAGIVLNAATDLLLSFSILPEPGAIRPEPVADTPHDGL